MKNIYYLIIVWVLIMPFNGLSQCIDSDNATENEAQNIKTPFQSTINRFNWREESYTFNMSNRLTSVPYVLTKLNPFFWQESNASTKHLQEQPVNAKDFEPKDGWELVAKFFGEPNLGTVAPYFVLYNRYEAILRVFVYVVPSLTFDQYNAARIDVNFILNTHAGKNKIESGLLGYTKIPTKGLDKFDKNTISSMPAFVRSSGEFWLYADFAMAYDPCTCNYFSNIRIDAYLMKISKMELLQEDITQATASSGGSTTGVIPIIDQFTKDIANITKKVTTVSTTLKAGLDLIQEFSPKRVVHETKTIVDTSRTTGIAAITNFIDITKASPIPFALPAWLKKNGKNFSSELGLFIGIIDLLSGSGTPTTTTAQKGLKFKITGTDNSEFKITSIDIYVPGSNWNPSLGDPLTRPIYNNTLGLFALVETPKIKFFTKTTTVKGPLFEYKLSDGRLATSSDYNHVAWDFKLQEDVKYAINPASGYKSEPKDIKAALVFQVNAKCLNENVAVSNNVGAAFPPLCTFNSPNTSSLRVVRGKKADGTLSDTATITTPLMSLSCIKDYVAHLSFLGNTERRQQVLYSTAPFAEDVRLLIMATLERTGDPTKQHLFTAQYQLFPEKNEAPITNTAISNIALNPVFGDLTLTEDLTIRAWETVTFKGKVNTNGFKLTVIAGTEVNIENPTDFPVTTDISIGLPTECKGIVPAQRPSQLYAFCAKSDTKKYNPIVPTSRERDEEEPIAAQKELKTMLNVVPNPFANQLTIHFALQEDSNGSISLTNAIGQVIKIQEFTQKGTGKYEEIMETNDVAPGVYYLTLQTKSGVETKKIVKQL
ncbi:MAG: hypothetical protein RLZZ628_511 [Bacteroidota bacterium]